MKRTPYTAKRIEISDQVDEVFEKFRLGEWLDSKSAAIRLGRFTKDGNPSIAAIHMLVYRKQLIGKKVFGKLMFHISEIRKVFERSPSIGG